MTQRRKAQLLTLATLLVLLVFLYMRQGSWRGLRIEPRGDVTPQEAVYRMLDAARRGDVEAYLNAHAGQMETTLRAAIAEKGERGFAAYLRELNAPIKGIAITEPQYLSDREARLRVEYVYQDRNEAQTMDLEKIGGQWKITRAGTVERVKTVIPYGTPVE